MVLRSNVGAIGDLVYDRLILTSVAEWKFVCLATSSVSEQLVTQADTKYGLAYVHGLTDVLNGNCESGRVAGTVGNEETMVFSLKVLGEVIIVGDDFDRCSFVNKSTDDVVFDATVNSNQLPMINRST